MKKKKNSNGLHFQIKSALLCSCIIVVSVRGGGIG